MLKKKLREKEILLYSFTACREPFGRKKESSFQAMSQRMSRFW